MVRRRNRMFAVAAAATLALSLAACSAGVAGGDQRETPSGEYEPEWVDGVLQPTPGGYPSAAITLATPTGPQEDPGIMIRHLQPVLERLAGVDVRVLDRPDLNNSIPDHLYDVSKERPSTHGYIVPVGSMSGAISRLLTTPVTKELGIGPDSFTAIQVEETPYLITARAEAPFDTFEEFAEYAKENPGELINLSRPPGSATALALDAYLNELGLDVEKVVGGSQDELALALGAGQGDIMINIAAVSLPHLQGDKIKLLACTGNVSPCDGPWPDLPLAKELVGNDGPDPWKSSLAFWFTEDTDPDIIKWWEALAQALPDAQDYVQAREQYPGTKVVANTAAETRIVFDLYWENAYATLDELGTLDPSLKE